MNRRKYLKSVASAPLLPNLPDLELCDSLNYVYLDSLFKSDYETEKNSVGTLGKTYAATFVAANREYIVKYRAYDFREDTVDVYDNTVSDFDFKHYLYLPQNSYEAWTLTDIGRKQGLESLLSALNQLELEFEGGVEYE